MYFKKKADTIRFFFLSSQILPETPTKLCILIFSTYIYGGLVLAVDTCRGSLGVPKCEGNPVMFVAGIMLHITQPCKQ